MKFFRKYLSLILLFSGLYLSGCATTPRSTPTPHYTPTTGNFHIVERGQTLYRIAKMYNVEVSDLMRANGIYNPSQVPTGSRLVIPGAAAPIPVIMPVLKGAEPFTIDQVRRIIGPKKYSHPWKTITVHHSGTFKGSAKAFDRDHRRRRMGGLFYHFVVGNGTSTPMGSIEKGWRWHEQVKANRPYDIQICLVGNFDRQQISDAQLNTLVNMIVVLQEQYNIPVSGIRQHRDIPGKRTDCPGNLFPFKRLISTIKSR